LSTKRTPSAPSLVVGHTKTRSLYNLDIKSDLKKNIKLLDIEKEEQQTSSISTAASDNKVRCNEEEDNLQKNNFRSREKYLEGVVLEKQKQFLREKFRFQKAD